MEPKVKLSSGNLISASFLLNMAKEHCIINVPLHGQCTHERADAHKPEPFWFYNDVSSLLFAVIQRVK